MAIAQTFDYFKPKTAAEAVRILNRLGAKGQVLAGGTDLVGLIADDAARPGALVDIKGLEELSALRCSRDVLRIGALVTFTDLLESPIIRRQFPVFAEMIHWVASRGIRNRATMIGNICSAVPCCDSGPILLLYEAEVVLKSPRRTRRLPIEDWFRGPRKTAIGRGEIVTSLAVPRPHKKHAACFVKLRRYRGEDLAQASVGVLLLLGHHWLVSFGSVAPTPVRGRRVEKLLEGRELTDDLVRRACAVALEDIAPITDIRATREYRNLMAQVMLERALRAAASRFAGEGPDYGRELI